MTQAKFNFCHCFGIIIFACTLAGCVSLETEDGNWADVQQQSGRSSDSTNAIKDESGQVEQIEIHDTGRMTGQQFERSAADKTSPEKEELLLYAVSAYLDEQNLSKAAQLLEQTGAQQLPQQLYLRQQALYAALYIKQNNRQDAAKIVERLNNYTSDDPVFIDWLQLIQAQMNLDYSNFLASLKLLNRQTGSNNTIVRDSQNQAIWSLIKRQTLETLEQARMSTSENDLLGWIELGIIDKKRGQISTDLHQQSTDLWVSAYPQHPASQILDQMSSSPSPLILDRSEFNPDTHIALLLPISSDYADIATAIRDGFQAASEARGTIARVYDTGSGIDQIIPTYRQALLSGADVVVGPLGNTVVNYLARTAEIVRPTILLGTLAPATAQQDYSANTFSYSLDPEHEAESLAQRAYNRGFTRIAILYPDSSRGKRLNSAFAQSWRNLGGTVSSSIVYSNDLYEAGETVDRLLDSGGKSADAIFLASNSQQGRLLSQTIFKRLPDITIFATSSIYSGQPDPTRDFVLNNIIYSDMPWMIEGYSQAQFTRQQLIAEDGSASDSLSRYFAFGVDAHALATRLPQFVAQNNAYFSGVTGNIQLDGRTFVLTRPLIQFVEGIPRPVN